MGGASWAERRRLRRLGWNRSDIEELGAVIDLSAADASDRDRLRSLARWHSTCDDVISWARTGLSAERCMELADFGVAPEDASSVDPELDLTLHGRAYVAHGLPEHHAARLALIDQPLEQPDLWLGHFSLPEALSWQALGIRLLDALRLEGDPVALRAGLIDAQVSVRAVKSLLRAGVPADEVLDWSELDPLDPEPWARLGIPLVAARRWRAATGDAQEVASALERGFTAEDIAWRGFDTPAEARPWRGGAWPADDALKLHRAGIDPSDAERWHQLTDAVDEVLDWAAEGFDAQATRPWLDAGWAAAVAGELRSAGIEPSVADRWREAGRHADVLRWAPLCPEPDAARALEALGVDPAGLRGWLRAVPSVEHVRLFVERGVCLADAEAWVGGTDDLSVLEEWIASGVPPGDAEGWIRCAMSPADRRHWMDLGVFDARAAKSFQEICTASWGPRHVAGLRSAARAREWVERFTDPDDAKPWLDAHFDVDQVDAWRAKGVDAAIAARWSRLGVTPEDLPAIRSMAPSLAALEESDLEDPVAWLRSGFDLGEAAAWARVGPVEECTVWRAAVQHPDAALAWIAEGLDAAIAAAWNEHFDPIATRRWMAIGAPAREAAAFVELGARPEDIAQLPGITAREVERWYAAGFPLPEVGRWRSMGGPELCAVWRRARFDVETASEWARVTDDPAAAQAAIREGLSPADVARWDVRRQDSFDQALEYWRAGVPMRMTDPHWYGRYAFLGMTAVGAAEAIATGLELPPRAVRPSRAVNVECAQCGREAGGSSGRKVRVREERRSIALCAECLEDMDVAEIEDRQLTVWDELEQAHGDGFWRRY